jgi:arylsulfatase
MGRAVADSTLTARPEGLPAWDDVPDDRKPILAHQMEVYAGFLEYADVLTGRLIDALHEQGINRGVAAPVAIHAPGACCR